MLLSRSVKLLVLGCGLVALAGCDRQGGQAAQGGSSASCSSAGGPGCVEAVGFDRSHRGSALPDMTFSDPEGNKLALGSLKGKPLLINLWATWCAPCVKELPTLDALAARGQVRVLTVSQDSGEPAKVAAFLKDKGLTHLQPWLDPDNNLAFHYGGGNLPMTLLYDSAGREVWRFAGEHDWAAPGTASLLAEAR